MAASIRGEIPNLEPLKKLTRDDLRRILESKHGVKDLFIDADLMKPIDRLADIRFLKEHGVDKIFKIDTSKPVKGNKERFYITRPKVCSIKLIIEQMKAEKSAGQDRSYTIVMVPRSLYICEKILEEHGVYGWVTIETLSLNLIPIDRDIITMELEFFYKSYFLNHDETWVHSAASALVSLQQEFGKLQNVYAIGQCAKSTWDLSQKLLDYGDDITGLTNQIGHAIILDRDVDLISPLCSQVTYEGLLDDIFTIQCGVVEFDKEVTGGDKPLKVPLNAQDELFEEVRNKHFSTVFKLLSSKAKELQKNYDKKDDMSVSQMKDFVANDLKGLKATHKSLTLHISACEVITKRKTASGDLEDLLATEHGLLEGQGMAENIKYIEECIYQQQKPVDLLRLMCLLSLVKDGLSVEIYESLKTSFLQIPKGEQEVDLRNPTDMSYVFSGAYTPLSCRLVQLIIQKRGFSGIEESIKLITNTYVQTNKAVSAKGGKAASDQLRGDYKDQTVLVCFLGGVTYSEIAALRFLGHISGYRFLILTTNIITGNRFISRLKET